MMTTLYEFLRAHSEQIPDEHQRIIRFHASGNLYIERHLPAIEGFDQMFVPIVDDIERVDLRMRGAPADAVAMVLKREGLIT